jgi:hypothetical protein
MNLAQNTASVALAAGCALLANGKLRFYSGTIPATPETAITSQVLLAELTFAATPFGAPSFSGGLSSALAAFVSASVLPGANGTTAWARAVKSDGTTVVCDYSVGVSASDIIIANTTLSTSINLTISALNMQLPAV